MIEIMYYFFLIKARVAYIHTSLTFKISGEPETRLTAIGCSKVLKLSQSLNATATLKFASLFFTLD